jgi:hypothetical protein
MHYKYMAYMKMAVFWVVAPCSLVEFHGRSEVVLAASIIRALIALMVEAENTSKRR